MLNRNIKEFKKFLFDKALMEEVAMLDTQTDVIVSKKYNQLYFNQLLMMDIVSDSISESLEDVVLRILAGEWDKDPKNFYDSIMSSKRIEFLTPYTIEEISTFNLFKVKGYKIGFAIKKDGEIVLVHNNEGIKGLGIHLMKKAIQYGGKKLDHFDGFLTGFYKKLNFKFSSNDYFDVEFAPKTWEFTPINIENPENSIYADEIKVSRNIFSKAKDRYSKGMPDIVYRKI